MSLPFTVTIEPPSWLNGHLRKTRRVRLAVGLTLGALVAAPIALILFVYRPSQVPVAAWGTLVVQSQPAGATVLADGQRLGTTPMTLSLAPGPHSVTLQRTGYTDLTQAIQMTARQTVTLAENLWPQTPRVRALRPIFPGATISDASFLANGQVVLTVALPPSGDREAWVVAANGAASRLGPTGARTGLMASPDGKAVAYLASTTQGTPPSDPAVATADEVWVAPTSGNRGHRLFTLQRAATDERLVSLSWAPDGRHLLAVSQTGSAGALGWISTASIHSRLFLLDPLAPAAKTGDGQMILSLPSEILPDSVVWSPRGDRLAFLARTGSRVALCLVRSDGSDFRYLTDLEPSTSKRQPFPPIAWAPAGQAIVYARSNPPSTSSSGWLFGTGSSSQPTTSLFVDDLTGQQPRLVSAAGGEAPGWDLDGSIVTLVLPDRSGPLLVRAVRPSGQSQIVSQIPLPARDPVLARWDLAHRQVIVATPAVNGGDLSSSSGVTFPSSPALDYWLVQWTAEEPR